MSIARKEVSSKYEGEMMRDRVVKRNLHTSTSASGDGNHHDCVHFEDMEDYVDDLVQAKISFALNKQRLSELDDEFRTAKINRDLMDEITTFMAGIAVGVFICLFALVISL